MSRLGSSESGELRGLWVSRDLGQKPQGQFDSPRTNPQMGYGPATTTGRFSIVSFTVMELDAWKPLEEEEA
ncbi:unnamed protein product [Arctogadus glacialis]